MSLSSRTRRGRRGQALAEITLCLPFLLILALGIIEVSRMLEIRHVMSSLTREGANLATRGGTLEEALDVTRINQMVSGLGSEGGVVVTRIVVESGVPRVQQQVATPVFSGMSRVGLLDSIAAPYAAAGLRERQRYVAVEVFYPYRPITAIPRFVTGLVPETLYDRTLF